MLHRTKNLHFGYSGKRDCSSTHCLRRWIYTSGRRSRCALSFSLILTVSTSDIKISEGSLAAIWHASIGNVAAGSVFAILQSLGTAPLLLAGIGALTGAAGCFLHFLWNLWRSPRWYQNIWGDDQDDDYGSGRDSEKTSKRLEC